ncbi:MAG: hypothetical protein ACYC9L_05480 [Sulfuricaulis sp.]
MATTLQTLVDRTRNFLRDTPDYDQVSASLTSSQTTVSVADTTVYRQRWPIEVDYESMMIRSISGGLLNVTRGWRNSASASHAASASVLMRPAFYAQEIIDAINAAQQACFPYIYKPVVDTSLTVVANQYQYSFPNMPGTSYPIPFIYKIEILQPGDYTFRLTRRWEIGRGDVTSGSPASSGGISSTYPILKFKSLPPISAVIRVQGFGPMPTLVNLTDTLDTLFPPQCEHILHRVAGAYLLQSGEAGRDRADTGAIDRREEANRGGLSLQTASGVISRAEMELIRTAMPPPPRHVKAVI